MTRLTQADASFIYTESASGPMHISSVYILDGELDFNKLVTRFEKRMHLVPAYRKKLMQVPFSLAHPVWVDDPDFDLNNHLIHHEMPEGTPLEEAMDTAVELNEAILDRSRPLWKFVMISGVPGNTLLLQETHHAMIDGASGIELTMILYDIDPNAGEPVPPNEPWEPEPIPNMGSLVRDAMQDNMREISEKSPVQLMSSMSRNVRQLTKATEVMAKFAMQPAITAPFNAGPVGPRRKIGWLKKPFGEIREIRRHLGGTINDVVLLVVTVVAILPLLRRGRGGGPNLPETRTPAARPASAAGPGRRGAGRGAGRLLPCTDGHGCAIDARACGAERVSPPLWRCWF